MSLPRIGCKMCRLLLLAVIASQVSASPFDPIFNVARLANPMITPAAMLKARAPQFTDSITPFSISITPVSISITPFTLSTSTSSTSTLFSSTTTSTDYGPTPTCTQTIKPDKNGYLPPGTCNALWNYYPSFGAAVLFSILFGIPMLAHITQAAIYKKKFCWVVIMGVIWEFGSYVSRALSTRNQQSTAILTVSQLLVLLAPLWINAFDYMVLSRMINFFIPTGKIWMIKPSRLAFVFVCLDIVSFIIQLIGGGEAGPTASPQQQLNGIHLYMIGIGIQEAFIVTFSGLAIKFHFEMLKAERSGQLFGDKLKWRRLLYTLYGSLLAISVRIIFRLIEFSGGETLKNPIPNHEAYFYVFDGIPMLVAILLWNITHPGSILQGPDSEIPRGRISQWFHGCCCSCCGKRKAKNTVISPENFQKIINQSEEEMNPLQSPPDYTKEPNARQEYMGSYDPYRGTDSRSPSPYIDSRDGIGNSSVSNVAYARVG